MDWESYLAFNVAGLSITDQDVEELKHERSIRSHKSSEEIESLTVDENLAPLERALLLLRTGQDVQKVNSIQNLTSLVKEDKAVFLQKIFPLLLDSVKRGSQDVNVAAAKEVTILVEQNYFSSNDIVTYFLPLTLEHYDHSDTVISKAWQGTLQSIVPFLPSHVIKDKILSLAKSIGQLTQRVHLRIACCSLLGKLAINLDCIESKKDLIGLVQTLCQDVELEVRSCMCRQLAEVAKGVGQDLTKSLLLPELMELIHDEETVVRQTGLETVSDILSLLDDDTCTDIVIPLVRKFCSEVVARHQDDELLVVSRHIGKLAHGLSVNLTLDQAKWFMEIFRTLTAVKSGDVNKNTITSDDLKVIYFPGCAVVDDIRAECRRWCAYNFPAMLLFARKWNLEKDLLPSFHLLARDKHYLVRKTVACGTHEVCRLFGCDVGLVYSEVKLLLEDDSTDVLQGIIPYLSTTLRLLFEEGNRPNSCISVNISELIPPLLIGEQTIGLSRNWRLHVKLLETFECLPDFFTSEQIFYKFIPLLFRLLSSNRVLPVKLAAGRTLCVFLKYNKRIDQRNDLCARIINELGRGKSYQLRILYLDVCKFIMELFSRQFFKDHFFEFTFQIAFDPVVNVRIKFCSILPTLKSQIKLPTNRVLLQQLENCARQMMVSESDRDVSAKVREAVVAMDKIAVTQDVGGGSLYSVDFNDKLKEDHEKRLIEEERNLENLTNSKGLFEKSSSSSACASSRRRPSTLSQVTKDVSKKVGGFPVLRNKDSLKQMNCSKSDFNITSGKGQGVSRPPCLQSGRTAGLVEPRRKNSTPSACAPAVNKSQATHMLASNVGKYGKVLGDGKTTGKKQTSTAKRN